MIFKFYSTIFPIISLYVITEKFSGKKSENIIEKTGFHANIQKT